MKRCACLYLPDWPIQRLLAERPELKGRGVVVYRADARGEWVVACSAVAGNSGVRRGMPLAEAAVLIWSSVARLSEAGPRVHRTRGPGSVTPTTEESAVLSYDPVADRAALGRLAERCEQFSPVVGWDTIGQKTADNEQRTAGKTLPWFGESPGHLFLDVTGIAPLFGSEETLARLIATECREAGYIGYVAIADTVGAAWAVAQTGEPVTIVRLGELKTTLRPLSVSALRLPVDVLDI